MINELDDADQDVEVENPIFGSIASDTANPSASQATHLMSATQAAESSSRNRKSHHQSDSTVEQVNPLNIVQTAAFEIEDGEQLSSKSDDMLTGSIPLKHSLVGPSHSDPLPDMWSLNYIGLYAQVLSAITLSSLVTTVPAFPGDSSALLLLFYRATCPASGTPALSR